MRRLLKILTSFLSAVILLVLLLPVVLTVLFSIPSFQNYAVRYAARYASEKLGTTVSVENIRIKLFNRAVVKGFYVEDFQGDTLLYLDHIDVGFRGYNPVTRVFRFEEITLRDGGLYLRQDSTLTMNIKYVTEKLKRDIPEEERTEFRARAGRIDLKNFRLTLRKYEVPDRDGAMNFGDLDLKGIDLHLERMRIRDDSIRTRITDFSFTEKSGLRAEAISAQNAVICQHGILLDGFHFADPYSDFRMDRLWFKYDDWTDFGDFEEKVVIDTEFRTSRIALRTIGSFTAALRDKETVFLAEGAVRGTIGDFSGRFDQLSFGNTRLEAKFGFKGLPDFQSSEINGEVFSLITDKEDIDFLLNDLTDRFDPGTAGIYLQRMGEIRLAGEFHGTPRHFQSRGEVSGEPGTAEFVFNKSGTISSTGTMEGRITALGFHLGALTGIPEMGTASFRAEASGILRSDSVNLRLLADVDRFDYKRYSYGPIGIEGGIDGKNYRGIVRSGDPNLDFDLTGRFLRSEATPRYDFRLDLRNADLAALHLNRRDSLSAIRGELRVEASGIGREDLNGIGEVRDFAYYFNEDTLRAGNIRLEAINRGENRRLALHSDVLDIDIASKLDIYDIVPYAKSMLSYYLPSLYHRNEERETEPRLRAEGTTASNDPDQFYMVSATIRNGQKFTSALLPGLFLEDGTEFSFLLNPATKNFSLVLGSGLIEYKNLYVSNLIVTNSNQADSIALYVRTDEVGIGNFYMPGFSVVGGVKNNLVNLGIGFNNQVNGMSAMINSSSRLVRDEETGKTHWNVRLNSSYVSVGENQWRIASPGIMIRDSVIEIDRFRLFSSDESLDVHGVYSRNPGDTLHVELYNFDISPLSGLLDRFGYTLSGKVDGHADLFSREGNRLFYAELSNQDIAVNGKPLQDSYFRSYWDPSNQRILTRLTLEDGTRVMNGGYEQDGKRYFFDLDFPRVDLALLEPLLNGVLTDVEGEAEAHLRLEGSGNEPSLDGTILFSSFAATVDFTKVRYRMENGRMNVAHNNFELVKNRVYDEKGGSGEVELQLTTDRLADMNYRIRITPEKLLALDTDRKDNDIFYGEAYASGEVLIEGGPGRVNMNINAQTENNSYFFMPLSDKASIEDADFIVFTDPDKPAAGEQPTGMTRARQLQMLRERRRNRNYANDLQIHMDLRVLPNTEVQLIFDPTLGEIIKANGVGNLTFNIRPNEDLFTMYGDYEIVEGSYLFTLLTILNKSFSIERGSSIRWVGDPLDALLDITAIYRLRTSLSPLLSYSNTTSRNFKQTVPVECLVILTDRLSQPTVTLDVNVPTADAEIRSAVQSALNTQESKTQQFMWLVMTRNFMVDNTNTANIGTTTTAVTGIEFVANQISNWLSNERFSLNLGYKPKDDISSDEFEASFSSEIIRNKLLLEAEANYNLGNTKSMSDRVDNQLTGDFAVTYIFDRIGNFRGKVFTRTIDRYDENQGLQEHGVGLYYKKDFNTFSDLLRRRRREKSNGLLPGEPVEIEITTENDGPVE